MDDTRSQEDRARRAAKRIGLKARKSRWRAGSIDNLGDFQIIDPQQNWVIAGERFDLTADDVVEFCAEGVKPPLNWRKTYATHDLFAGGRFNSREFSCSGTKQRFVRGRKFDVRWSGRDHAQQ